MEILVLCYGWAQSRNQTDFGDRRFYPTPDDVKYVGERYKAEKRLSVLFIC